MVSSISKTIQQNWQKAYTLNMLLIGNRQLWTLKNGQRENIKCFGYIDYSLVQLQISSNISCVSDLSYGT